VPLEIRTFPTRPEAATAARDFWLLYNGTREAKKAEFLKAGKDHRGKKVTSEQEASLAAYLFAEEDVHNRIKASGMYLEICAELVKLVFDRELTLEPPRNPDGSVKPVADGILGGPHTLDGFLDMAKAAGVTRKYVPITWESDRVRADAGRQGQNLHLPPNCSGEVEVYEKWVDKASPLQRWLAAVQMPRLCARPLVGNRERKARAAAA